MARQTKPTLLELLAHHDAGIAAYRSGARDARQAAADRDIKPSGARYNAFALAFLQEALAARDARDRATATLGDSIGQPLSVPPMASPAELSADGYVVRNPACEDSPEPTGLDPLDTVDRRIVRNPR